MAVQFEFYKNPGTGEEGEEEQYHPRVVNFNSVSTSNPQLRAYMIQKRK